MRRRFKSQAFIEFAFILPIVLVLMMTILDYGFMIMRMQVLIMAAREGAITAASQPVGTGIPVGLHAVYTMARSVGVDFSSANGGVIITHVWYDSSKVPNASLVLLLDSNYVGSAAPTGSPANVTDPMAVDQTHAVGALGGVYGGGASLLNQSRILPSGSKDWTSIYRQLPIAGSNLVDGDTRGVYAVEVMYTNTFITPIGNWLSGRVAPSQLYAAAFNGVPPPP